MEVGYRVRSIMPSISSYIWAQYNRSITVSPSISSKLSVLCMGIIPEGVISVLDPASYMYCTERVSPEPHHTVSSGHLTFINYVWANDRPRSDQSWTIPCGNHIAAQASRKGRQFLTLRQSRAKARLFTWACNHCPEKQRDRIVYTSSGSIGHFMNYRPTWG